MGELASRFTGIENVLRKSINFHERRLVMMARLCTSARNEGT